MQSTSTKIVDIPENVSLIEYAQNTKGLYINLLNLCGKNPVTGKYECRYIITNKSLMGEKVKFEQAGQSIDATVVFSCLGTDYKTQKRFRRDFKKMVDQIAESYQKQERLDMHISGEHVDLKEMRKKGLLDDND